MEFAQRENLCQLPPLLFLGNQFSFGLYSFTSLMVRNRKKKIQNKQNLPPESLEQSGLNLLHFPLTPQMPSRSF